MLLTYYSLLVHFILVFYIQKPFPFQKPFQFLLQIQLYEGRSIYKEPVAAVFLIFELLKIQDIRFVENTISNIFG